MGPARLLPLLAAALAAVGCRLPEDRSPQIHPWPPDGVEPVDEGLQEAVAPSVVHASLDSTEGALLGLSLFALAGAVDSVHHSFGVEYQAYPAGHIFGFHSQHPVTESTAITYRLAANVTDRGDWGEQDDEEGAGWGGGMGFRSYLTPETGGVYWGVRADLWLLEIDWTDDPGLPSQTSGESDVLVLQPTAEVGYGWRMGDWRWELGLGLGFEINCLNDGRDVGDGPIGLLGFTLLYHPR